MSATPSPWTKSLADLAALAGWAIAIWLFLRFFNAAKIVLLGILAAGCFAAALYPLRRHVPGSKWVRAFVVGILPLVTAIALVALVSWLLAEPIRQQIQNWPEIRKSLNDTLASWGQTLGFPEDLTVSSVLERAGNILTGGGTAEVFSKTANIVAGTLIALAFIFFGTIYLLGEREDRFLSPVLGMLPRDRRPQVEKAFHDLIPKLRWWLIGTLISMVVVGVLSGIGYWIVGVQFALPLAVLAGISEIIPTLGPAATFLIAILFAATQGTSVVIGVVIVYAIVQMVESYLLLPFIMKEAVRMPPVVTLFTIVLWGQIFGFPGLLLAIPLNLVVWTFANHLLIRRD